MTEINLNDFQGIALDFDGTIAVTLPSHKQARADAFAEHGLEISDEISALGHKHGNNATTIIGGILKEAGYVPADADSYTHSLVTSVVTAKSRRYSEITGEGLELNRGFLRFLQTAAKYYTQKSIALVTTAPLADVLPTLERNDITQYFNQQVIVTSDTAHENGLTLKPAPDQYEYAFRMLGIAPKAMLVVEDSPGGVIAGHRAGAKVLAVGNTEPKSHFDNHADPLAKPDYFAESFEDVLLK